MIMPVCLRLAPCHTSSNNRVISPWYWMHTRFLFALPIPIAGERPVHLRRIVVRRFVERQIVRPQELTRFDMLWRITCLHIPDVELVCSRVPFPGGAERSAALNYRSTLSRTQMLPDR
jgi:hypothetical protein